MLKYAMPTAPQFRPMSIFSQPSSRSGSVTPAQNEQHRPERQDEPVSRPGSTVPRQDHEPLLQRSLSGGSTTEASQQSGLQLPALSTLASLAANAPVAVASYEGR